MTPDPYITQAPIKLSEIATVVSNGIRYDLGRARVTSAAGWLTLDYGGWKRYIRISSIDVIENE